MSAPSWPKKISELSDERREMLFCVDFIHEACGELINAMSALNMEAMPLDKNHPDYDLSGHQYLSETDVMAHHAMEHIHAAFDILRRKSVIVPEGEVL